MRSPAAAIAWTFWRPHRWGFAAVAGYLLALVAIRLGAIPGFPSNVDRELAVALLVIAPFSATLVYLLAVFSFGFSGDFAARQSIYPTRAFTLPVPSRALAGWPMVYGAATVALVWSTTRWVAPWPAGVYVPLAWPGVLTAVLLAWAQALTWMPYGLRGVRVAVIVLWLSVVDAVAIVALEYQGSETVMLALLAPHLPLAYLAARYAVGRARRGDVPDWRGVFARRRRPDTRGRRRRPLRSPGRAQAWFEWRLHGRSLPVLVGILLPFELALLLLAQDAPALAFAILVGVALTPPFMATFAAAAVRKADPGRSTGYGVSPLLATRPVTSASLIAAKLEMAILSTLVTWLLVLIAVPLALRLTSTAPIAIGWMHRVADAAGTPRAIVLAVLALTALVTWTWKQLVQSLYIGLSGRVWFIKLSLFLALVLLTVAGPLVIWIVERDRVQAVLWTWKALPVFLAVLTALKLSAATWVATRLYDARLVSDRAIVVGAACWVVVVLAVYGALVWLVDTPYIPSYLLLLVATLATPLARVSAAPLALAWNRHR